MHKLAEEYKSEDLASKAADDFVDVVRQARILVIDEISMVSDLEQWTSDVLAAMLLDAWTHPHDGAYSIKKMKWLLWKVWAAYGEDMGLELADHIEEHITEIVVGRFHLALTAALHDTGVA